MANYNSHASSSSLDAILKLFAIAGRGAAFMGSSEDLNLVSHSMGLVQELVEPQ